MTGKKSTGHGGGRPRTFLIVWTGQLISSLGNGMTAFALAVYVYQQTRASTAVALVLLCLFLPAILLRPFGGLLADRYDRRMLIVFGDLGSASGVLFILISVLAGGLVPWKIYLGVTVSSVFVALQNPAYKASVTDLLPPEQYSRASGLVQLSSSAQHLVSPMVSGILLGVGGLLPILLIDLCSFGIAVAAALAIGRPLVPLGIQSRSGSPDRTGAVGTDTDANTGNSSIESLNGRTRTRTFSQLKQGWKAMQSDGQVMAVVIVMSITTLFLGVLQTVFAPMLLSLVDVGTLGIVQSISASGMLVSSLILGAVGIL